MAIRYSRELRAEIDDTIRRYNAKIDRVRRKGNIDTYLIPEKRQYSDFIGTYNSRQELKRELSKLQRYTNRGAEQVKEIGNGEKITNWEYQEIKRDIRREKSALTKEIHKYEQLYPHVFGKKQDVTYAQMGDIRYENLKSKRKALSKNIDTLSRQEFKRLQNRTKSYNKNRGTEKQKQLKENYIQMLLSLGYVTDVSSDTIGRIKEKIDDLSPSDFNKLFESDEAVKAILDYYYPSVIKTNGIKRYISLDTSLENDVINLYEALEENLDKMIENVT